MKLPLSIFFVISATGGILSYYVDKWLQVWPRKKYPVAEVELPLHSIAELIDYAVRHPTQGFIFYQQTALREGVQSIILKFTFDGKVVFGISISQGSSNFLQARAVEAEIRHLTGACKTYIAIEYPPVDDDEEFDADMARWQSMSESYD